VESLVEEYSTPFFVYLPKRFEENYLKLKRALSSHLPHNSIFYAVKANYLGKILLDAKKMGMGLEVMSLFELLLAKKAGFEAKTLIFNGPAKTEEELDMSLDLGLAHINVESISELKLVENLAKKHTIKQPITIRIHPSLSKTTENRLLIKKSSKLGIDHDRAKKLYSYAKNSEHLEPKGVHVHVGTNLTSHDFYDELLSFLNNYLKELESNGIFLKEVNLGGGLASANLLEEKNFNLTFFAEQIASIINSSEELFFLFEPGRYLIADSFIAVTKVLQTKKSWGRKWAFTDIGANSLIPLRYTEYQVIPSKDKGKGQYCNIGGPLCLPVDVIMNKAVDYQIDKDDVLVILNCGAYTLSLSEQFGYPRPAVYELKDTKKLSLIKSADSLERMVEESFQFEIQ